MKRSFSFLLWAGWLITLAGCSRFHNDRMAIQAPLPPLPDLIAQIHFAGASHVSADTNSPAFTNLWCSPEARALREQTLNKLSRAPHDWLSRKILPGPDDGAGRIRPLLDDLLSAEWFLDVRDATNGSPELALAIHLNSERARLWQANLANVLESWTGLSVEKIQVAGQNGWQLKKHRPPNLIRLVRTGDWVVLGCGQDELPLNGEIARRVLGTKRPAPAAKNYWLNAEVDWPRLSRWLPSLQTVDLPKMQMQAAGHRGSLHLDGTFIFPQPPALTLEPWRMPTNTIHQPFISFTAVRGIGPWLEKQGWAQPLEISPAPDQIFIWAMPQIPFQTFAAVPVPNATNALAQIFQKLSIHTNWQSHFMMPFTMTMTNNRISWGSMPFISPKVTALHEPAGDFLVGEFFPNTPITKPLPPELFARLGRTNLIYYHREITAERLKLLPQLTQLALMLTRHKQLDTKSAAAKWLDRIGQTPGTAVTEITQTAPDEWSLKRTAPAGLTAIELIALANWLEATNFPGCDLHLPPPRPFKPKKSSPSPKLPLMPKLPPLSKPPVRLSPPKLPTLPPLPPAPPATNSQTPPAAPLR